MRRVVIESPLSGDFARNIRYARLCGLDCRNRGEAAYASHLFYPQFLDDQIPGDREFGITAGFEWAQHCHLVALYWDLGISVGMMRAREFWTAKGKTVETRNLPNGLMMRLDEDSPFGTPGARW